MLGHWPPYLTIIASNVSLRKLSKVRSKVRQLLLTTQQSENRVFPILNRKWIKFDKLDTKMSQIKISVGFELKT